MAKSGLSVSSRFALLKVEDDEEEVEQNTKNKTKPQANQQSANAKKRAKKKKKAEATDTAELRNLAFGKGSKHSGGGHGHGDAGASTKKQWDEWKRLDEEYTAGTYEKDLQEALMASKLDFEHDKKQPKVPETNGSISHVASGSSKDKKKKKKEKPGVMSLDEFKQLPPDPKPVQQSSDSEEEQIPEPQPVPSATVSEPDPTFFEEVDKDVTKIIQREKIQEQYRKQYIVESARTQQYNADLEKKDEEISSLKETNQKLEEELKQVKKRNQQLCFILSQGEMKDKKSVLVELEQLKTIRDELTQEVTSITTELEKERSTVHALREEITRLKDKGGKHGK